MDQISALLKRTMPFQMVGADVLAAIGHLVKMESHARGDIVYQMDDTANDIYVVASGSVQHTLRTAGSVTPIEKVMGNGDVFGWAAIDGLEKVELVSAGFKSPLESAFRFWSMASVL